MKLICAWCGRTLKDDQGPDSPPTHGICPLCAAGVEAQLEIMSPRSIPGHSASPGHRTIKSNHHPFG